MDFEFGFLLMNASVLPAWFLLIVLPRWSVTALVVHSMLYPLALGALYTAGLGAAIFGGLGAADGGFTTIAAVRAIFSTDIGVLVGWAHYLVFDLFIGAWEARDAKRRSVRHWLLVPCLLLTFMAGPLGLLLYLVLRQVTKKGGWTLEVA